MLNSHYLLTAATFLIIFGTWCDPRKTPLDVRLLASGMALAVASVLNWLISK